jgi:formate dehydrogenase maturation protein FdhE
MPAASLSPQKAASLSPEKAAAVQALAEAIRQATNAEIEELAATLIDTDDAHLFGQNEFKLRSLALKIAAKALEQHLAQKKTATRAPA